MFFTHINMKFTNKYVLLFVFLSFSVFAQEITLEQIWGGAFRTKGMDELYALKMSNEYSVLNYDRTTKNTSIDVYDFATLEKVRTLINTSDVANLNSIDSYSFNATETKLLLATNSSPIFRHSFTANYFVYDIATKKLQAVTNKAVQEPSFSKDGMQVAYAFENNLYILDLDSKKETQITTDGEKNKIINGITDWVYEEEFAFVKAYEWNKDGSKIAYIKFNETDVHEFSMDMFNQSLYPTQAVFKYPKAGEQNAIVSLHIVDVKTNTSNEIKLGNYSDFYIPRIKWTNDSNLLSVQVLNRHQNNLNLHFVNATNFNSNIVLNEKDKAYIDITDNLTFLEDNSFIWTSEKDGYNHI